MWASKNRWQNWRNFHFRGSRRDNIFFKTKFEKDNVLVSKGIKTLVPRNETKKKTKSTASVNIIIESCYCNAIWQENELLINECTFSWQIICPLNLFDEKWLNFVLFWKCYQNGWHVRFQLLKAEMKPWEQYSPHFWEWQIWETLFLIQVCVTF